MVFLMLSIKAELENLINLQPRGGSDDPNYAYYFKLKCERCGEISQKTACVTLNEDVQIPNSRGTANLVQKCKFCGCDGSIQLVPGHGEPVRESGKFTRLMVFDCRGSLQPIVFSFGDGWIAESEDGTRFEVNLSEGEFAEYDEEGGYPVTISNLESKFDVVKKVEKHGKLSYQ